jgi:hypothetical protein
MTPAQMKFLSGFLRGSAFEADSKSYWGDLLHEPPASVVNKFVVAGLLTAAPLAAKLDAAFKATEIKGFLRDRGLPLSGRKAECIERLLVADSSSMETKVAGINAFVCTAAGKEIAEQFLAGEEERSRVARERSLRLLQDGDVHGALATVAEFERQQVFQRGIGVDWSGRPSTDDVDLVRAIMVARPKILRGVADAEWRTIQTAAAMLEMWGERSAKAWLPDTMVGSINLDRETTTRMVLFCGQTQAKLAQFRRMGCTKVEVMGTDASSCPECRRIAGKKYRIDDAPEVPCANCTNELGCRCMLMPVLDSF